MSSYQCLDCGYRFPDLGDPEMDEDDQWQDCPECHSSQLEWLSDAYDHELDGDED